MNLYQITAERIAAAARTAYPDREIKVVHAGRIVSIHPKYCVSLDHDGVRWGEYGTDVEYVAWEDPAFGELINVMVTAKMDAITVGHQRTRERRVFRITDAEGVNECVTRLTREARSC